MYEQNKRNPKPIVDLHSGISISVGICITDNPIHFNANKWSEIVMNTFNRLWLVILGEAIVLMLLTATPQIHAGEDNMKKDMERALQQKERAFEMQQKTEDAYEEGREDVEDEMKFRKAEGVLPWCNEQNQEGGNCK